MHLFGPKEKLCICFCYRDVAIFLLLHILLLQNRFRIFCIIYAYRGAECNICYYFCNVCTWVYFCCCIFCFLQNNFRIFCIISSYRGAECNIYCFFCDVCPWLYFCCCIFCFLQNRFRIFCIICAYKGNCNICCCSCVVCPWAVFLLLYILFFAKQVQDFLYNLCLQGVIVISIDVSILNIHGLYLFSSKIK